MWNMNPVRGLEVDIDNGASNNDQIATTALIRYRTLFLFNGSPLIITFSLGDDVLLRADFDLPIIILFRVSLDFTTGTLNFSVINIEFLLNM